MYRNLLVQYDGGGYDGCVWEWNFFYFDKDGDFENIFASGSSGIETKEKAIDLLDNKRNGFFSNKVYTYDLSDEKDLAELAKELNVVLLTGLVKWFNDYNVPEAQPYAVCGKCGCKIEDRDEICLEDWRGCGGIMSTADSLLCYECRSIGACCWCNEYLGADSEYLICTVKQIRERWDVPEKVAEGVCDSYAPVCEYCCEKLLTEEIDGIITKTKT